MNDNLNDRRRADALRATPVPVGLRASLLEQVRNPDSMEVITKPKAFPRRSLIGIAAAVALSALLLWEFVIHPPRNFDQITDYREAVAYYIAKVPFQLDFTSGDRRDIQTWLDRESLPTMPDIPVALGDRVPLGCKQIGWGEVNVSLICFFESESSGRIIHLFIAPRNAVSEDLLATLDDVVIEYGRETRGWVTDDAVCLLVPSDPAMAIAHLLDSGEFQAAG